ncbi:MAG: hypothetical protein ACJ0SL_08555 [Candidatus Rariloculaceae bacterium]
MSDDSTASAEIPVLTDVIQDRGDLEPAAGAGAEAADVSDADILLDREMLISELQAKLSVGAFTLTEQLLHSAISEMEATLFEQVLNRLRQELPELVDTVLREHLIDEEEED